MNHSHRKKRIILLAALLLVSSTAIFFAIKDEKMTDMFTGAAPKTAEIAEEPIAIDLFELPKEPLFQMEPVAGSYVYTNKVDGYTLTFSSEPSVDTTYDGVRSELSWTHCKLYVYKERCADELAVQSYISYSNSFIADEINFSDVANRQMEIGKYPCTYVSWTREAFSRVTDDLNCYSCFDIVTERGEQYDVYTLYFKYDEGVEKEELVRIARSFEICEPTAEAPAITLGTEDGPSMNWKTELAYRYLFSDDSPLRWGIFDYNTVKDMSVMEDLEAYMGYHFAVQVVYTNVLETEVSTVNKVPLAQALSNICKDGTVPELTLQTVAREDGRNMVFCILQGEYDTFLHNYAAAVAEYGKPVLFRLGNEMNGDWCPYSAFQAGRDSDVYLAFYQYIFDIFRQEGVDNAIWVWNPNGVSFPNFKWNRDVLYYPGDEYVNVVGMTAYNTGTYYEGEKWTSFRNLYRRLYDNYTETYAQPLMITEFACSGNGGDKAAWIVDMFRYLEKMPRVKVAIWWNGADYDGPVADGIIARPYFLEESDGSKPAFRAGVSSPFYIYLLNEKSK